MNKKVLKLTGILFSVATAEMIFAPEVDHQDAEKCTPTSSCWPTDTDWQAFNATIGGALINVSPYFADCFDPHKDQEACQLEKSMNADGYFRSDSPGSMMMPYLECYPSAQCCVPTFTKTCEWGSVSLIAVNATNAEQVKTAVAYAAQKNLKLTIKSTGHDFQGRSTSNDSLNIWVHHMKEVTFIENWTSQCEESTP